MTRKIERAAARADGLTSYFTGRPCKHGHIAERSVSCGQCVECRRGWNRGFYAKNAERLAPSNRARANAHYHKNKAAMKPKRRAYYEKNRDAIRARNRKYSRKRRVANPAYQREWRKKNLERVRAYHREYARRNSHKWKSRVSAYIKANAATVNLRTAARRALKLNATPPWISDAERCAVAALYKQAARLTRETGVPHHVDHIIPMRGLDWHRRHVVCGLHILANLQIVTRVENLRKGAYRWAQPQPLPVADPDRSRGTGAAP